MKLYTNEGNPASLKIVIAASYVGEKLELNLVSVDDYRFQAPRRLPVLETESGCRLFSTNAASRLVLPPHPGCEIQVDQWLEWEAAQLQKI
uniref:Methionine--tRNA ligase N-terminal domain-containing protein n=1 Tax=Timema genevievae TaxID=629358 RepID=A0A7R9PTG7_TIMGE|nr:unnamed protein product [Timema genevievae]